MPAQKLHRENKEGIYSHIYNKGVDNRIIFNEEEDYAVFLGYLKDYLSVVQDPESIKKDFMVHGRIFRGTPHQPKNYFTKVELIAYSLMPDHFHLLLHQMTRGSLESFIRSLCTRYSMYFNKKYKRTGALFEGPYKSAQIKDESRLPQLTRYFHHTGSYCSYPEYLGARETSWVKPKVVLSFFGKGTGTYKNFVEKYELDQKGKEFIKGIIFESETQHLEGRGLVRDVESSEKIRLDPNLKPLQRVPEFLAATVLFLLLVGLGVRNIMVSTTKSPNPFILGIEETLVSTTKSPNPSPTPSISNTEGINTAPADAIKPKLILTVKVNEASASVNIRQKPTTDSEKVGQAKAGDTFEFVSIDSGWYEVRLTDRSTGFILATFIEVVEEINE